MANWLLSGFASGESYDKREPDWEGDKEGTVDDATLRARDWLRDQPTAACVEVIADEGSTARVVRLVTHTGVEDVG
jgi:hypothetical protein